MWGPKQEKVRKPRVLRLYCWIFSMRMSEEKRSVRDGDVAVQRGKQNQNHLYSIETHTSDFMLNTF